MKKTQGFDPLSLYFKTNLLFYIYRIFLQTNINFSTTNEKIEEVLMIKIPFPIDYVINVMLNVFVVFSKR